MARYWNTRKYSQPTSSELQNNAEQTRIRAKRKGIVYDPRTNLVGITAPYKHAFSNVHDYFIHKPVGLYDTTITIGVLGIDDRFKIYQARKFTLIGIGKERRHFRKAAYGFDILKIRNHRLDALFITSSPV